MTDETASAAAPVEENVSASGHLGLSHEKIIGLYIGTEPENENEDGTREAWGYRRIATHFGCSTQNVRRHITSEKKKYPDPETGEPTDLHVVFPIDGSGPTVPMYVKPVVVKEKKVKELPEAIVDEEGVHDALLLAFPDMASADIAAFTDLVFNAAEDAELDINKELKATFGKESRAARKIMMGTMFPDLSKNASNKVFASRFMAEVYDVAEDTAESEEESTPEQAEDAPEPTPAEDAEDEEEESFNSEEVTDEEE